MILITQQTRNDREASGNGILQRIVQDWFAGSEVNIKKKNTESN
jgi:hypothetical protein